MLKKKKESEEKTENELRILFVEDLISYAELIFQTLRKNGILFSKRLVDNKESFEVSLNEYKPDLIISDYSLPQFDGMSALNIRNKSCPDIPFILVTGSVNEEVAADCIKNGADDYILKSNLSRLPKAVINALANSRLKKEKTLADNALRSAMERLNSIFRVAPAGIGLVRARIILDVNPWICNMTGYTREELVGKDCRLLYPTQEEYDYVGSEKYRLIELEGIGTLETRWQKKDGSIINIILSSAYLDPGDKSKGATFTALNITERKKTEEDLRISEMRLRNAQSVAHVGNWELDLSTDMFWASEEALMIYGLETEQQEVQRSFVQRAALPEFRPVLDEAFDRLLKYNEPYNVEYKIRRLGDGQIRFLHAIADIMTGADSPSVKITGIVQDITDLKKAEYEFQTERNLLKTLIDTLPHMISIKDSNGCYLLNNRAHMNSVGVKEQSEMLGKTPFDFFPRDEAEEYHNDDIRVICTGVPIINKEEFATQKDHPDMRWLLVNKIPIKKENGAVSHLISISNDITDWKKAEEEIRKERLLLRTLIDNLPDPIYVKDAEARKVIANKADLKNIGLDEESQALHKTDLELFPGDTGQRGYNDDIEVLRTCNAIIDREEDFIDKNGNQLWLLTSKIPLIDKNGMVNGLVGIGRNITRHKLDEAELLRAKEKAEESDRLKTAFLHNISHEIRTPMNAIMGFTTLLAETEVDAATRKNYIEVIQQSGTHLMSIISDIVDISNIEANLVKVQKEEFNLNDAMKQVFNQHLQKARDKKIDLVFENGLKENDAKIITDKTKLIQILSNLVNNAVKFTNSGQVKFDYKIKTGMIEFCVADTGIGIPAEQQPRIFDRFYQVQNAKTRIYEGTGLGLAICKAYTELLGGSIRVLSQPERGSSFFFTIPLEVKPKAVTEALKTADQSKFSFAETKKILVAEDIESNFKLIRYFLTSANVEIVRALNGKEAVDLAMTEKGIDLILMDIKMPILDGYEATRQIREFNKEVPIIAQTAYADDKMNAIRAGCSGFIAKPFDKFGLLRTISEFL
jgi:hypothetical protein